MKRYMPYLAILTAMLIWAASGIAIKEALSFFPPLTMIVARFSMSVLLMLVVGLICRGSSLLSLQKLERKDIPLFLLGGFFQPFLYYLLETYTYDSLSSPTIAEALLSTSPLLAPFFAFTLLKEIVTRNNIIGIAVSTIGMFMLVLSGSESFAVGSGWGVVLAFASVSAAVLYTIVLRRIPVSYNSLSIVFYIQALSLVFFVPLWIGMDASKLSLLADAVVSSSDWVRPFEAVVYLAVFSSVTAFILFCYTVRQVGVTRANAFNNIRPVFTALIMLFFFSEHLPLGKWAGIILIIVGLFVSQRQDARKAEKLV